MADAADRSKGANRSRTSSGSAPRRGGVTPSNRPERCPSRTAALRHEAPYNRVGMKGPAPGRRNGRVKLRGSPRPEVRRRAGAATDNRAAVRRQRVGCGSKAERRRETELVVEAPRQRSSPEAGGYGLLGRSVLIVAEGRLVRLLSVRTGEAASCVAVRCGDAPGVQLGADPAYRLMVNVGSAPAVPAEPLGSGQAHRPLWPPGRLHGEGVQ